MKRGFLTFVAAVVIAGYAFPALAEEKPAEVFTGQRCNLCHSVKAAGIEAKVPKPKGPDLSKVGATRDAKWIHDFLKQQVKLDEKKHPLPFKGSDEQLGAVADWLAGMK
jgi:mono/diheme cytochrome c family protein